MEIKASVDTSQTVPITGVGIGLFVKVDTVEQGPPVPVAVPSAIVAENAVTLAGACYGAFREVKLVLAPNPNKVAFDDFARGSNQPLRSLLVASENMGGPDPAAELARLTEPAPTLGVNVRIHLGNFCCSHTTRASPRHEERSI